MLACAGVAHGQTCSAPGPAAAAGYTTQTLGPAVNLGSNWSNYTYLGNDASGDTNSQGSDGSVVVQPGGNNYGGSLQSNGAFGGGGYFQATMTGPGPMSFWADDIQTLQTASSGQAAPDNSWIEADMAEFDNSGQYGGALHNWYGSGGSNQAVSTYNSGSPFANGVSGTNTYGFLWVPATATTQGYVKWYFNGQQVGNTITWNQYQPGQSATSNPYAVMDSRQLELILGTGASNGTVVSNVQVWQASAAGDSGLSSASVTGPCPAVTTASATSAVVPVATPAAFTAAPTATPVVTAASADQDPTPGNGSATDCSGNTWSITSDGKMLENGAEVPGGHGTSDLLISGCTVYGEDAHGGGWYTMSSVDAGADQYWNHSAAPTSATVAAPAATSPSMVTTGSVVAGTTGTVIPAAGPVQQCATPAAGAGGFHVAGGQIIGPDGKPWIARGVNIYGDADPMGVAGMVTNTFKGVNMIRYIVRPGLPDPSSFQAFITQMTSQGIVVEVEHHPDGGGGQDSSPPEGIPAESAWYAAMAKMYAGNTFVWFGSFNEPAATSGLSSWEQSTYNAVRSGSNTILMLEVAGSRPSNLQQVLDPSVYASMTNVVWDAHYYGYINDYGSDPTDISNTINAMVTAAQTIKSADGVVPVIIGESGPSTTGSGLDANGYETVDGLITVATSGSMGGLAQFTWYPGFSSPNNMTDDAGNPTQPYGQKAQLYIGTDVVPLNQCQLTAAGQRGIADATASLQATQKP